MEYTRYNPVARYAQAHPENIVWTEEAGWVDQDEEEGR